MIIVKVFFEVYYNVGIEVLFVVCLEGIEVEEGCKIFVESGVDLIMVIDFMDVVEKVVVVVKVS